MMNYLTSKSRSILFSALVAVISAPQARAGNSTLEDEMFGGAQQGTTQLQPAAAKPTQPKKEEKSVQPTQEEQPAQLESRMLTPTALEQKSPETLTLGGRLELQTLLTKGKANSIGDAPLSQSTSAELYLDSRPSDDLRGFAKGAISQRKSAQAEANGAAPTSALNIDIYEMWVKWGGQRSVFTTVGKQKLKWGAASFWNPTDFLAVQPKDPFATYDVRPGTNLLKLHMPFEKSGNNLYALVNFENASKANSPTLASRAELNYGFGDFSGEVTGTVAGGKDQPLRFGLDLSTGLGPVDLVVESAWTRKSKQEFYRRSTNSLGNLAFVVDDRSSKAIAQIVTGIRYDLKYSDSDTANLSLEYFWNDAGYSDVALEAYSFVNGQSPRLYLANRYVAANITLIAPGNFNDSTVLFAGLCNLTDKSWLARASLGNKISTRSSVEFALAKAGGLGEFTGGIPNSVANDVKAAVNLPEPVRSVLDRVSGVQQDWTLSATARIDL
ncbi:hypothetical protein EBU99_05070 [bacterium]|nr:hypothetical protein [bacterium]